MNEQKFLSREMQKEVLETAETKRDKMLILIMLDAGARVSETISVKAKDIHFDSLEIEIKTLKKKRLETRTVPMSGRLAELAMKYITEQNIKRDDWLFRSPQKGKNGFHISRGTVNKMIEKLKEINPILSGIKLSPHSFRHSMATNLRAEGADNRDIKDMLGHESTATTEIYASGTPERMRELINSVKPRQNLFKRIINSFKRKKRIRVNWSNLDSDFIVGREREAVRIAENLRKKINTILTGDVGLGKSTLLEAVIRNFEKVLILDDTRQLKNSLGAIILKLLDGDREAMKTVIYGESDNEQINRKMSRGSVANLCNILISLTEKNEYILCINDITEITPAVVRNMEVLAKHFVIFTTARKISVSKVTFLSNFEKIELEPLKRTDAMKMIVRLSSTLEIEDKAFFKTKIHDSSSGNPQMIRELIERLSKEPILDKFTINQVVSNYIGREMKQIDMSIYLLLFFASLAVLRYMASENGNTSLRFIGGCFMIFALFGRYFFNGFKRKSL
jgi:integrase/recombinase XerD